MQHTPNKSCDKAKRRPRQEVLLLFIAPVSLFDESLFLFLSCETFCWDIYIWNQIQYHIHPPFLIVCILKLMKELVEVIKIIKFQSSHKT